MNISLGEAAAADYKHIRKLYKKAFPYRGKGAIFND